MYYQQEEYKKPTENYNQTQTQTTTTQTQPQQQKTIKNPKPRNQSKQKTPQMNQRDILNEILATEKYLTDSFNIFSREASHIELHSDLRLILDETHNCTRNVFNIMFEKGFYKMETAPQQKLQKVWDQFSNYLNSQAPY
jgi:spore coat protein CotF